MFHFFMLTLNYYQKIYFLSRKNNLIGESNQAGLFCKREPITTYRNLSRYIDWKIGMKKYAHVALTIDQN